MAEGEWQTQVYFNMFSGYWGIRKIRFWTDASGAGSSEIARAEDLPVTWIARANFFLEDR